MSVVKPKPSFAPIYCGMYPGLAAKAKEHGYALAVHGSLQRDFDLICIPWVAEPSQPAELVKDLIDSFALRQVGDHDVTHHGRIRYILSISFGECFVDLSFMPIRSTL